MAKDAPVGTIMSLWGWENESNWLPLDLYCKTVATGAQNVAAVAMLLDKKTKRNPNLLHYLTFKRLSSLLLFFDKGFGFSETLLSRKGADKESNHILINSRKDLRTAFQSMGVGSSSLKADSVAEIPTSSLIELLIELLYKSTEPAPTTMEEMEDILNTLSLRLRKLPKQPVPLGIPASICICTGHRSQEGNVGIILTASKARWYPLRALHGKLADIRQLRFPGRSLKEIEDKTSAVYEWWKKHKAATIDPLDFKAAGSPQPFNHDNEVAGAFQLSDGRELFIPRVRCAKCYYLYGYHWKHEEAPGRSSHFNNAGDCAEDLCHAFCKQARLNPALTVNARQDSSFG